MWYNNSQLVFIVGSPRSGTTWLQALLADHPKVYTGPETHFFVSMRSLIKDFETKQDRKLGINAYLGKEEFRQLLSEMFYKIISKLPTPEIPPCIFIEKTPHHAEYAQTIVEVFPNAKFIHLIRDVKTVVASLKRISKTWGKSWVPDSIDDCTYMWIRNVKAALKIPEFLESPQSQYMEIKYEDLRENTIIVLESIWKWLNLDFQQVEVLKTVEYYELKSMKDKRHSFDSIADAPANDIRPDTNVEIPKEFIGLGKYTQNQSDLNELQERRIEYLACDLIDKLGYPMSWGKTRGFKRILMSSRARKVLGLADL